MCSFLVLVLFSTSCNQPDNSREAQANRGKVLFDKHCLSCHGQHGDGPVADTLAVKPTDLTLIMKSRKATQFPIAEIARFIDGRSMVKEHMTREMPIWGNELMSKENLATNAELKGKLGELVAYLMSIQKRD